ncbi:MAG: 8-amino-7-oxononanoate synthase [Candidatus Omnitrophica bacterium]|nr:8-amino-7-oxononanoate synthase [Candidatus Omnitrophota bacterium]
MGEIRAFLDKRKEEGLLRRLNPVSSRRKGGITLGGKEYIDFSSNDYLGLSGHPKLIEASKIALDEFGSSSSASRLLSGSLKIHHRLERELAGFKNKESSLVFNSGYQANVGILSSLYGERDAIFSDKLNHASIIDGISLSGARIFRFFHNDPEHLELLLKRRRGEFKKALIITETIFSMDGDRPPLKALVELKERYGCRIMVDEAHATGIFGKNGAGIVEEKGLSDRVDLIMGTFSKALGSFGAYVAASAEIIEYLINACRSFIYSTSLPPAVIAANLAGLEMVKQEPYRRQELLQRADFFRGALKTLGLEVRGLSQIVPVIAGASENAQKAARSLQEKGYWVMPIRPPTVPAKEARLRFSLTYDHGMDVLKKLIEDIADVKI